MEEDIKILEEFYTKGYSMMYIKYGGRIKANSKIERALENLIKGYRELEEENEKLINELQDKDDEIRFANRDIKVFETDFIPKSKIKEKIEELKKYRDLARDDMEERVIIADSDSLNYGRAEAHDKDIQVLQELLEDK